VLAVLFGAAALILSIVNANRSPEAPPPPDVSKVEAQQLLNDDADRSLCLAIGPLMKESSATKNAFTAAGVQGSPEQRAAIPKFVSDTHDWAGRAQEVLNEHATPPRYLTRTLQRYIDDMLLFVENISPDRGPDPLDNPTWELSLIDLGGPLGRCGALGVGWWN